MFTMSHKDLKHVNMPSLLVLTLPGFKCEAHEKAVIFDKVFDDAMHLRPYILLLIRVKNFFS